MTVLADETLARYAVQKAYFRADGTVRHNAFMPARDGNTSVFRVMGLSDNEKCEIGVENVAEPQGKKLLAWAEIKAQNAFDNDLEVIPDDTPPRHANLSGWPDDRSEQKAKALELAAHATLYKK